jgi:undecaprenyl-diphosphatase
MSAFEAIFLGIVQGLTEFLPISSSAHLRIAPAIAGWSDPGAGFTAVIQLGTMAAVLLYFWSDLWRVFTAWLASLTNKERRSDPDARMGWYLIVATIPISIFGLAFKDQIETGARNLWLIAGTLIVGGLVMLVADRISRRTKTVADLTVQDGITVGLAQSLALVPGVSRSGATISAGLFLGYTREDAARFSFLLSIPAVVLSSVFQLKDIGTGTSPGVAPTLIATVVSFVVGYAAIAWLLRWLTSHSLTIFVVYRLAMGALLIGLLAAGTINAR